MPVPVPAQAKAGGGVAKPNTQHKHSHGIVAHLPARNARGLQAVLGAPLRPGAQDSQSHHGTMGPWGQAGDEARFVACCTLHAQASRSGHDNRLYSCTG
jgi:hypothetical protein